MYKTSIYFADFKSTKINRQIFLLFFFLQFLLKITKSVTTFPSLPYILLFHYIVWYSCQHQTNKKARTKAGLRTENTFTQ